MNTKCVPSSCKASSTNKRPLSEEIFKNLCNVIPGGVNSPVRSCKSMQQLPMVVASASEDLLHDVDGYSYIDYCCSWGAIIHGHAHLTILKALQHRMSLGTSFGITTEIEGKLAKKIIENMPSIEKIRFVSSGTEATMSASRLARGYTGRDIIVKFNGNYHGHSDAFLVQAGSGVLGLSPTSSSAGIPADMIKHTISLPYNDLETCKKVFQDLNLRHRIAAVILEPIAGNIGTVPATHEFIHLLRELTTASGALLIFDEVITGFRISLGGAQALFGIQPDLTCLGKIIGGGFPAAAFGGRSEIMDYLAPLGLVYQAGTLSGNPIAMEAGLQTINLLEKSGFYEDLEDKTNILTNPIKDFIKTKKIPACVQQVGSMFTLFFGKEKVTNADDANELDFEKYARFFRYMFDNRVYIPPAAQEAWFITAAHKEKHLETTRDLIINFLAKEC